jgi:hypothetical protein
VLLVTAGAGWGVGGRMVGDKKIMQGKSCCFINKMFLKLCGYWPFMDLIARKKLREKKREEARIKKLVREEVFRKPQKVYAFTSKKMTILTFFAFVIVIGYLLVHSDIVLKDECGLMPGVECNNLSLTAKKISFEVSNFLKEDLNITLSLEGCPETISKYIRPNKRALYEFNCTNTEKTIKKAVFMTHIGYSGLPHNKTGYVQGAVK